MLRSLTSLRPREATCSGCGRRSFLVARALGACGECIRNKPEGLLPAIQAAHRRSRELFGLAPEPPRVPGGVQCRICANECRIPPDGLGYCGLRTNRAGKLTHLGGMPDRGILHWYYDPLPTNCVAEWVCAEQDTQGLSNLAVFYGACSLNCLSCQNWTYRELARDRSPTLTARELAARAISSTACLCFFGGDPSPQLPHAIEAARLAREQPRRRPLRLCWETNGTMHPALLRKIAALALESGGTIKVDLKAWSESLHLALTGRSNRRTLENFQWLGELARQRPDPPLVVASTLLIPGYVDRKEVSSLARFIAAIDPEIPLSLLAFHPHFFMDDLPTTSRRHAEECLRAARAAGLRRVRIGNVHLLGDLY